MRGKLAGLVCVAIVSMTSLPAMAGDSHHGHHGYGHGGGHGHGGGWRASFFVGGAYPAYQPYCGPVYYPPPAYYYYPPPAYPVYPAPVVAYPVAAPSFSFSFGGR